MANENGTQPKLKVFVSYSRKDMAFADRLEAFLKPLGIETLIDRTEIYAFEDWWRRIQTLIAQADTVIFVVSPDAVVSDTCHKEITFAGSLNKRFAPVIWRRTDDVAVPEALRRLNFIFFDDEAHFDENLQRLAEALQTDIEWIRKHTEFGEAARRWTVAGKPGPRGLLLRSPALEEAEGWIASRPEGAPTPTEDTQAFVAESRRAATQRRNILTGSLATGLLVAISLAGLAYWQRGIAIEQERTAREQRDKALLTQSRFLADLATQRTASGDAGTAMLFALEALPNSDDAQKRPVSPEAEAALFNARQYMEENTVVDGRTAAFSPNGQRIATAGLGARIWDANTGKVIAILEGHGYDPKTGERIKDGISPANVVNSVTYSPDGERVLTASDDMTARIWDANTGKSIAILVGHGYDFKTGKRIEIQYSVIIIGIVQRAKFSVDGRRVVTVSNDNTARIWNAETGMQIASLALSAGGRDASFSPDAKRVLTVSDDDMGGIWDAATGKQITVFTCSSAAFSPDGRHVLTVSDDNMARIWDAATGKQIAVFTGSSAAFSPDGRRVVALSNDNTARIWDANTGQTITVFSGHTRRLNSAAFSPDGRRVVTASDDNTARVWDTQTGKVITILTGHEKAVLHAAFSREGQRVLTASADNTARVWNANTGQVIGIFELGEASVWESEFSPDGTRILTFGGSPVRIWMARTPVLAGHTDEVSSATFSPDGRRVLTASDDKTARLWDANTGETITVFSGHTRRLNSAALSPDGRRVVTASDDNTARIWDVETGKTIMVLAGHSALVRSAVFSPDGGSVLTTSDDRTGRIWNAGTGKQISIFASSSASFSPDGRSVVSVVPEQNSVQILKAETGHLVTGLEGTDYVRMAEFSPDGRRVLTTFAGQKARIWDSDTGKTVAVLDNGNETALLRAAFSPDSQLVMTQSDAGIRIWNVETGRLVVVLDTRSSVPLRSFTPFSPDGRLAVTNDGSESASLWDAKTGKLLSVLPGYGFWVENTMFSLDGRHVLMISREDKAVRILNVFPTSDALSNDAKQIVQRCLTRDQRAKSFLDPEPPAWCIEMAKWPYDTEEWKSWLGQKKAGQSPPLPDARGQ